MTTRCRTVGVNRISMKAINAHSQHIRSLEVINGLHKSLAPRKVENAGWN